MDALLTTARVGVGWAELLWAPTPPCGTLRAGRLLGMASSAASPAQPCLARGGPRRAGHLLVWHGAHLRGGLQGAAQGAEEEPVWERQLLLAGLQVLLQR